MCAMKMTDPQNPESRGRGEMKLQVKKMKDQTARRENAFPDIAYHYEFDVETVSYLV